MYDMGKYVPGGFLVFLWISVLLFPVITGTCAIPLVTTSPLTSSPNTQINCELEDSPDSFMRSLLQPISENPERLFVQEEPQLPKWVSLPYQSNAFLYNQGLYIDQLLKPPQVTVLS